MLEARFKQRIPWRPLGALATGAALAAAFPPFESWQLAWVGLVPLLLALLTTPAVSAREGFRLGFLAGLVFWLVSLSWMLRLLKTSPAPALLLVAGWLLLAAYCAFYLAAFAMSTAWLAGRLGTDAAWKTLLLTLIIPVLWAGGEVIRSLALTGFPWNLLAISQFRNLALIQCAEWVGVPGVSALLALMNAGIAFTVARYLPLGVSRSYRPHLELFLALMTVALCVRHGFGQVRRHEPAGGEFALAAVQPAIPQVQKWTQAEIDRIHSTLRRLTEQALETRPDLIVWPETATPLCVTEEGESRDLVLDLCRQGAPLLVGSMDVQEAGAELLCYNSSFLFGAHGTLVNRYDKQHLVPFGEYIPLSSWIPPLARLAPMGWNCSPGRTATVFEAGTPPRRFACLICFEDSIAALSRAAVRAGARLLINQTNDAWFDRSAGPAQHLAHCVFRCVENRVPAVRVANTGISCLITPSGRILDATANAWRTEPEARVLSWRLDLPPVSMPLTAYTRQGDRRFGIPAAAIAGVCFVLAFLASKRKSGTAETEVETQP
jgi:apolipoprotein N-acyltransferase